MAQQNYQVRLTADTKSAADKLDAVQSQLNSLTNKPFDVTVGVDANALRRSVSDTERVAQNVRAAATDLKSSSSSNFISGSTLASAATLAGTFYGIRKDARGIGEDLAKSVQKTNLSEFMRTEKFLDRVLDNSRARTRDIVETYANIREIPGVAVALGPIENFARAKAFETYGDELAKQTLNGVKQGLQAGVEETKNFFYKDLFNDLKVGTAQTIDTLGRLGLAIQGVQLLVGPLAAAWSAAFDSIIGQNIRLEETILSTQTTLASTGRVIDKTTGKELLDPLQKIQALEGDVRGAIENIRVRSLDLAGVTSQQIIDIFGVVATSISQVNGNIKDAEDLAISFTAAMGTLGIPFYQARQEIGSILGGYITEDSLLAKRLQISNADIEKAKNSVDGVVGYLKKKLETAVAGQAISAKSFAGVMSNIQEIFEVIAQRVGQPLLAPLVAGLTGIYEFLKRIQGVLTEVGGYLSTVVANTITAIVNIFRNSKLAQSIGRTIDQIAQPYQDLARAIQLGLSDSGNLIERWVNGIEEVPNAFRGVVAGLQSLGNFLKLQIELITEPITQLLDQSRELAGGGVGVAQRVARIASIPFGNFVELQDTFTKGWDSLTSTIQATTAAVAKFAAAVIRIKITEITAQIRAAAKVFEVFGSVLLGRINLAVALFDNLGNVLGSDFAKFTVSLLAINKLIQSTDFFGVKGIAVWAVQTRVILKQLLADAKLFVQGFKDAGNIEALVKNSQAAYGKVFAAQTKVGDPVLRNAAQVEQLTRKITELQAAQANAQAAGAGTASIERYSKSIAKLEQNLIAAKKSQEEFTKVQRLQAAAKSLVSGGSAEVAQLREAARQSSVLASGAATGQALSTVLEGLATRLGMTKEEFKTLGGAAKSAGKSLQTFLTTSMLINIGFTAASLAIAAGISAWQQYEENVKAARIEALRMAQVQKILSSGYEGIAKAAEGGDVAAQRKLQEAQDQANAAMQIQQEKKNKLLEKEAKLNDEIYGLRQLQKKDIQAGASTAGFAELARLEGERTKNKKEQEAIDKRIYEINLAQQKVQQETNLAKDFTVLAERRKDLEEKIKTVREDYEKELSDKAFQTRMELLSLEQQKRREIQEQELKALRERFRLLSNNATDQDKQTLQQVQDYETALLEAANAEQNARAEFIQREQQLRKEIEDYAYKMQRERIQLEKQVGNYQKQLETYKNQQQDLRIKKELAALRQQQKLQGVYFQPYNIEQQQGFVNAAVNQKLNTSDAYALLQLIPKASLGITGTEDIKTVMAQLRSYLDQLQKTGRPTDPVALANFLYPGANGADLVGKLRSEAQGALNTRQFYVKQDSNSVTTPNLNIDWAGMNARVATMQESLIAAQREFDAVVRLGNKKDVEAALARLSDPSLFTDVKASYASDQASAKTAFDNAVKSVVYFGDTTQSTAGKINEAITAYKNAVRVLFESKGLKGAILDEATTATLTGQNFAKILLKGGVKPEEINRSVAVIKAWHNGLKAAADQVKNNDTARLAVETTRQAEGVVRGIEQRQFEAKANTLADALSRFSEAVRSSTSESYSLAKAQAAIRDEVQTYIATELSKIKGEITPEIVAGIKQAAQAWEKELLRQTAIYDKFNRALAGYQIRLALATRTAETWSSATKDLVTELMKGSSTMKEAFNKFSETVANEFVSSLLDVALAPVKEQILATTKRMFGVTSAEERARTELIRANSTLQGSIENLDGTIRTAISAVNRQSGNALNNHGSVNTLTTFNAEAWGAGGSNQVDWNQVSKTPLSSLQLPKSTVDFKLPPNWEKPVVDSALAYSTKLKESTDSLSKIKKATDDTPQSFSKLQKGVAGAVQALSAVAMAVSGVEQIKEGGTYNTLMGIASIFGAIGSITGMFGKGGVFGKKASGGPVSARIPYLVGEQGPELFVPNAFGSILPNNQTDALLASRGALYSGDPSSTEGESPESGYTPTQALQATRDAVGTTPTQALQATREAIGGDTATSTPDALAAATGASRAFIASNSAINASRAALAATTALSRERQIDATLTASLKAQPAPMTVNYESRVINNVEYVTADQFQRGISDAAERGRALTLNALKNSVKARRQVGI